MSIALVALALSPGPSFARTAGGAIQGTLFDPNGNPVVANNVNFKVQVLDKSGACVLYEESHPGIDLSQTNGDFSFDLGYGTSSSNYVSNTTILDENVFRNDVNLAASASCPSGVTMTDGDPRLVHVQFDLGSGFNALSPDMQVQGGAYAAVAQTIQGRTPANFIQVVNDGTTALTQANQQTIFSVVNFQKLLDLLSGNVDNQKLTNVSPPTSSTDAATKGYADSTVAGQAVDVSAVGTSSGSGDTLIWSTSQNKWVAGSLAFSGTAGGDLTGNYPSPTIRTGAVTLDKLNATGGGINRLLITDGSTGTTVGYATCSTNQIMSYNTTTGWTCTSISSLAPVTSVAGKTGAVTLNAADINGLGSAALLNYGTSAGEVVALNGTAQLPAVDGSLLTNVNSTKLGGRNVSSAAPTNGQVLSWNSVSTQWQPQGVNSLLTFPLVASPTGSANAPAYSFSGSTQSGLFSPSADTLGFTTAGTSAMTILANGNVGIGTTSASGLFDVSNNGISRLLVGSGPFDGVIVGQRLANDGYASFGIGSVNNKLESSFSDNDLRLYTSGAEHVRFTSLGSVGIGTTSPLAILDIYGTGAQSAMLVPRDSTANRPGTPVNGMLRYNASTNAFEFFQNNAWVSYGIGASSGTVTNVSAGVGLSGGTITTTGTLSVNVGIAAGQIPQLNAQAQIALASGNAASPVYTFANSTNTGLFSAGAGTTSFASNGTASVTITPLGLVGIGTTLPFAGLDVATTGSASAILVPRDTSANRPNVPVNGMLRYNASLSAFEFYQNNAWVSYNTGASSGTITSIVASTGLLGGTITSTGTVSVNVGTGVGQIVQENASAQIAQANGSVTAPTYSFANSTTTGFFSPAANSLALSTNGVTGLNLDSNGYVSVGTTSVGLTTGRIGIGTSAPQASLSIGRSNVTALPTYSYTNSSDQALLNFYKSSASNQNRFLDLVVEGDPGGGATGSAIRFLNQLPNAANVTEAMRIDTNGSVGIGTASPMAALDVFATGSMPGAILVPRDSTANRPAGVNGMLRYNASTNAFEFFQNNAWVSYGTGSSSGTLTSIAAGTGLLGGTITASGTLSVNVGTAAAQIVQLNASAQIAVSGGSPSAPTYGFANSANTGMFSTGAGTTAFASSGVTAMTIDGNAHLGVGTAFPAANLDVANVANADQGTSNALNLSNYVTSNKNFTLVNGANVTVTNQQSNSLNTLNGINVSVNDGSTGTYVNGGKFQVVQTVPAATSTNGVLANVSYQTNSNANAFSGGTFSSSIDGSNGTIAKMTGINATVANNSGGATITSAYGVYTGVTNAGTVTNAYGLYVSPVAGTNKFGIYEASGGVNYFGGGVGIGTSIPAALLDVYGTGAQSAMLVPRDSTANRPAGVNGMLRYNASTSAFEFFQNNAWVSYGTSGAVGSVAFPLLASPATTSASAPSYSFSGNTNTGLFSPFSNQVALAAGGNTALTALANGNVGVGTSSPQANLQVYGYGAGFALTSSNPGGVTNFSMSNGNQATISLNSQNTGGGAANTIQFQRMGGSGTTPPNAVLGELDFASVNSSYNSVTTAVLQAVSSGTSTNSSMPTYFAFQTTPVGSTTPTERVRFDSAGNVGIGTTGPLALLDVYGTGSQSALLVPRDSTGNRPSGINGMLRYNASTNAFEFFQNNAWVSYNTGAVGAVSFPLLASPATTSAGAPSYSFSGNTNTGLYSPGANQLALSTNGTTALAITSAGAVGIGTGIPGAALDVLGTVRATGNSNVTSGAGVELNYAGGAGSVLAFDHPAASYKPMTVYGNPLMLFGANGSGALVDNRGFMGILTYSPQAALDVAGSGTGGSAMIVPRDTTANRPTGVNGMLRYNASTNVFEFFQNNAWVNYGTSGAVGSVAFPLLASPGTTTASAPSYSFSGNTNTGLFSPATNQVAVTVAGSTALSVSSNGFVGIGSTSPGTPLDVVGSARVNVGQFDALMLNAAGFLPLQMQNVFGSAYFSNNLNWNGSWSFNFPYNAGSQLVLGGGNILLQVAPAAPSPTITTAMIVTQSSLVGIGTVSPMAQLDVYATGTAASAILVPRDSTANRPSGINGMLRYNASTNAFEFFQNNAWVNYGTSGAVGSVAFPLLASPGTTAASAPSYSFGGSTTTGLFSPAANQVAISTAGTTALLITNSGNLGIGTSSPGYRLDVSGSINIGTGSQLFIANTNALSVPEPNSIVIGNSATATDVNVVSTTVLGQGAANNGGSNAHLVTAIGYAALSNNYSWTNTAVGALSLNQTTSGGDNVAMGYNAGGANVNGVQNTLIGTNAGRASSGDSYNVAVGGSALYVSNGGSYNTAIGRSSGLNLSTGSQNTFLGHQSGGNVTTGSNNIVIGYNSNAAFGTASNQISIGNTIYGNQSLMTVGIGSTAPQGALDVFGTAAQSSMLVPRDTTANRPTGVNGMLRYNTSSNAFEFFQNNAWVSYGTTGAVGSVAFPLLASPATASASAPTYSFVGNANTGMFSPMTNQVALATAGTTAVTIAANGFVGIGTTSPATALDVNGGIRPGSSTAVTATCNATTEGIQRYNYSTHFVEYCNGTNWTQITAQAAGSTTPVNASGPPVGASTYSFSAVTANYTPGFGSIANTYNGNWPAVGSNASSNTVCAELDTQTAASEQIVYDLGSNQSIGHLYVSAEGQPYGWMSPYVSFSQDNVTYNSSTYVYLANSGSIQYSALTLSTAVTARYIKVTNGGSASSTNSNSTFCQIAVGP